MSAGLAPGPRISRRRRIGWGFAGAAFWHWKGSENMKLPRVLLARALVASLSAVARAQSSGAKAQVDALIVEDEARVKKEGTDDLRVQLAALKKLRADMEKPLVFPEPIPGEQLARGIEELRAGI